MVSESCNVLSIHEFTVKDAKGSDVALSKYKGPDILAFPCNQFGGQEPGTNEEIANFVCTPFKAEYPIFNKNDIKKVLGVA
ncbi:putative phospholipid hydroperoxide glutathione peroxidase [Apium graveolens]|uniref:putative phospholipid hydroperoxide glutathione peroxidase n=1 Tax=Apium graveolens TaxID=4045 RepID=UPI003D79B000